MESKYTAFFLTGFVIYAAILVFIGWYMSRGKSDGKNYLTGGGSMSMFLIFSTMTATLIGTGSSIGATANGFKSGFAGAIYGVGGAIGIFLLAWLAKKGRVREKNFETMSEEAQYYYGGKPVIRNVMGVMMYIIEIVWLGNHMNGGATYLSYVTGLDPLYAKIIALLAFAGYVFIGGYLAVVWTDVIQLFILLIGFAAIVVSAIPVAGGWEAISATFDAAGKSGALSFYGIESYGIMPAISLAWSILIPAFGTPTYRMRIYTSKDSKTAAKALNLSGLILLLFSFIPALIGMAAFTIATNNNATAVLERPDYAFSYMATTVLGPVMGLLFMIAGLSATLSSGDSDAIAGVSIQLQDIVPLFTKKEVPEENVKSWSRISLVITLLLAFVATLFAKDVISYISNIGGSFVPGVAVVMVLGACWKRVNWQGGLAGIFGGTLFGALYLSVPAVNAWITNVFAGPAIPATLVALVCCVVASLITPEDNTSEEERMQMVIATRGAKE